ncbi:Serine--tRNA ligase, mitochondrial [Lecanora helva]
MRSHVLATVKACSLRRFTQSTSKYQENQQLIAIPKPLINKKIIREQPEAWSNYCVRRNNEQLKDHPLEIKRLLAKLHELQTKARSSREQNNKNQNELSKLSATGNQDPLGQQESKTLRQSLIEEGRRLKDELSITEAREAEVQSKADTLAAQLPNIISNETPEKEFKEVGNINRNLSTWIKHIDSDHVRIGTELDLLDFQGAAKTSGSGWYFLKNEAVQLEQALVQYAQSVATKHGFALVAPPSMVYADIGASCGYRPRDQNGEQQIYSIKAADEHEKRTLINAGTAEIPFAGMKANMTFGIGDLPLKIVGSSRCFRAEAGGRGRATRGLYRVHEFTKVEMFAWTFPEKDIEVFTTMLKVQTEILQNLGLHCRILEMPAYDLGHSAARKQDIEAYFPSRRDRNGGWGEVTSTSLCTDYQTRRLATRVKKPGLETMRTFPYTVNGTALAVPRILQALLEYGYQESEDKKMVKIPEVLWPFMNGIWSIERDKNAM